MAILATPPGNCTFVHIDNALSQRAVAQFGADFLKWAIVVQQLAALILTQTNWLSKFQIAFANAHRQAPEDMDRYGVSSLNAWLRFINDNLVVWIPTEDNTARNVYNHLVLEHWVLNQAPVGALQSPIDPASSGKPLTLLSRWMVCFAQSMGSHLSSLKVTNEIVGSFKNAYALDYYKAPQGGWTSINFNDFFSRDINRKYRPVSSPNDDTIITGPADSVLDGQWPISAKSTVTFNSGPFVPFAPNTPLRRRQEINIKGVTWSIDELLETGSAGLKQKTGGVDLKGLFAGGIFTHSFLGPNDYHRQWAPISGKVFYAPPQIQGQVYLQVENIPDASGVKRLTPVRRMTGTSSTLAKRANNAVDSLEAPDEPGYQFLQTRGLIIIHNDKVGYVAIMPIGMAQVSSVVYTVKEGQSVKKGDEISYFQFGGSDCILLFQRQSNVQLTGQAGYKYLTGQQIGIANPK